MTNISSEYNRGYRRALQDVMELFESSEEALKVVGKHFTYSRANSLLKFMLENREKFREQDNPSIRWNVKNDTFEFIEDESV